MSSTSSTMSTISSTARPIARSPSEKTTSACAPSRLISIDGSAGTRGISLPRYWISGRPPTHSILPASISSRRVTSDSGTALRLRPPLRKTRRVTVSCSSTCAVSPVSSKPYCCSTVPEPTILATPFGSMISTTAPSPRMVLPENSGMWRSFVDIGLTTISSVWKTPSTRMPKRWRPTWETTTKPSSPAFASTPSRPSTLPAGTIGRSRSRRRSTGDPLMRSIWWSAPFLTRTSSSTATCGMA